MQNAIDMASQSALEVPIGAVIVKDGEIIARACNQKERDLDISAHSEILVLKQAARRLNNWRLDGCDMYVTLEPCPMCAWAIMQARVNNLYFGAYDSLYGAFSVLPQMMQISNSKLNVKGGIMEVECEAVLKDYFNKLRLISK